MAADTHNILDQLDTSAKVSELRSLNLKQGFLERDLKQIRNDLAYLESLPEVCREILKQDDLAVRILLSIKGKKSLSFSEIMMLYGEDENTLERIIYYADRAGYIHTDRKDKGEIYSLTEEGRKFFENN